MYILGKESIKIMKNNINFFLKVCFIFTFSAFLFSLIGINSPDGKIIGNPLDPEITGISIWHVAGHIVWGAMAGIAALSVRYVIFGGVFAIMMDADHLIQFLDLEIIGRMSHSIPFAITIFIVMLIIFGKKDYRLAVISGSVIFSHMSFDLFLGMKGSSFPLFAPFNTELFFIEGYYWVLFQAIVIAVIGTISLMQIKQSVSQKSQI